MNRADTHTDGISPQVMNRREFLTLCTMGTLSGLLAACQTGSTKVSKVTPGPSKRPSPIRQPSPTRQLSPTGADWSELARSLQGTLIRPDSPRYSTARQLFNTRFDSVHPAAIA